MTEQEKLRQELAELSIKLGRLAAQVGTAADHLQVPGSSDTPSVMRIETLKHEVAHLEQLAQRIRISLDLIFHLGVEVRKEDESGPS
jgi:hypothetical protein